MGELSPLHLWPTNLVAAQTQIQGYLGSPSHLPHLWSTRTPEGTQDADPKLLDLHNAGQQQDIQETASFSNAKHITDWVTLPAPKIRLHFNDELWIGFAYSKWKNHGDGMVITRSREDDDNVWHEISFPFPALLNSCRNTSQWSAV